MATPITSNPPPVMIEGAVVDANGNVIGTIFDDDIDGPSDDAWREAMKQYVNPVLWDINDPRRSE